jgi:DNA invertase Pin-like site-specific DNA recombinase
MGTHAPVRQLERLRAYARARSWPVAPEHVYLDQGANGLRRERPGLEQLLAAVARGDVELGLVASPDRLARDARVVGEVLDACEIAGCRVVFADRG